MLCRYDFLSEEQNVLLSLISESLFVKNETVSLDSIDFLKLWKEAEIQTVPLLSMNQIEAKGASQEEKAYFKNKLQSYFFRNIAVGTEHCHLHDLLTDAGIPYVIIKGMASSVYYPDELMRLMGDVDFIVSQNDMNKVDKILIADGYTPRKKENSHHVTYDKNSMRCEMHFLPPGIPAGETGEKIIGFFDDIIEQSSEKETSLGKMSLPSAYHHGLIILLHTVHHLTGDGLGLRHLCDWAVFASSFTEDEFRKTFEEKLRSVGLWKFAVVLTDACAKFLGSTLKLTDEAAENMCIDKLIEDVFSSGNFGQKNPDRSHESLFISGRNSDDKKGKSLFLNAIVSVNEIVYSHWKFVRKFKLFLPFGWLFFGGRYIIRSLMGKRPEIRMKQVVHEARERQKFYDELKIFEN